MKILILTLSMLLVVLMGSATPAYANLNLFGGTSATGSGDVCGNAQGSAICQDKGKSQPLTGPNGLIPKITRLIAMVAGAAAIIVILLSSLRYITASGDPKNIESAKNTLIGAVIGLIVIVLAQSIIIFVVDRLGKT